jgi:LPXTG-site transpeptidase (sortase) family protein
MKSTASSRRVSRSVVKKRNVTKSKPSLQKQQVKLLAKICLCGGIICFIILFNMIIMRIFPVTKQKTLGIATTKTPVEISIKDVGIDLPILPAQFLNGTFQTTTQGVSYLSSSAIPGDKGNTIMYAHNWLNLFGSLPKVKVGEKIIIIFSDKTKQTFTITKTEKVSAYATGILQPTENRQLTLFTCANFLDADRFVVIAN